MPPGTWRSATRSSATVPTTGSRSASAASCTPGPATPSPTWPGRAGTISPACSPSTTCTPSASHEAWSYSLQAAELAKGLYANPEAAEYFERAITAGRRLPELAPADIAGAHEGLGDARNLTGSYAGAASAYRAARRLIGDDVVGQARLLLKLARVEGWLDRYTNALRWIRRGIGILGEIDRVDANRQRAELFGWYGRFCQEGGKHRQAIKWCTQAVEQAEAVGDKETTADALRIIDWAKMDLGQLEDPVNWERALALFEEVGDLPGQAGVLNMLGGFAYFKGDWDDAVALYRRAQATARRTGNAVMDAFYVFNIGEIALEQGRLDEAEEAFVAVNRTWRAAGYRSGAADAKGKLARVYAAQARYEEALELFASCIEEMDDIGSRADALEASARMAECLLLSGDDAGGARPGRPLPLPSAGPWRCGVPDPFDPPRARHRAGPARPERGGHRGLAAESPGGPQPWCRIRGGAHRTRRRRGRSDAAAFPGRRGELLVARFPLPRRSPRSVERSSISTRRFL